MTPSPLARWMRSGCELAGSRGTAAPRLPALLVDTGRDVASGAVPATAVVPLVPTLAEDGSTESGAGVGVAVATCRGAVAMGATVPVTHQRVAKWVMPAVKTTSAAAAIAGRAHRRPTTIVRRFFSSEIT